MTIIDRIFKTMEYKNIKSVELANYLSINKSVISTWKSRGKNPPSEYIVGICELLDVSPEFLLTGKESILSTNLNEDEIELLNNYRELHYENKTILKGELFKLKKEQQLSNKKDLF